MDGTALRLAGILALICGPTAPAAEVSAPRGYFVLRSARDDRPVPSAILRDPNMAGVSARRSWASINSAAGHFDFGYLDREIAAAAARGKSVMLHVDACGDKLPSWVTQTIQTYAYVERNRFAPSAGQTGRAPIPWDETYLSAWCDCVRELGRRYDQNPTVVAIHVGGPSRRGSEVFFPAEVVKVPGYSAQRALDAWKRIFACYDEAFPSTAVVLDLAQPTADLSLSARQMLDVFTRTVRHPVVQHNSLSAKTSSRYGIHRLITEAAQQGVPVGFQQLCTSNLPRHGGSLSQALATARQAKAGYIEIYDADRTRITAPW
jgi:hypothetical protein